jgi:peptidoglycan/xylan/chitin deacetylase (PgdA/CDA1 family)
MTRGLPILTYHAVDGEGDVVATEPSWLAETLRALHTAGFQTVDLAEWVEQGRPSLENRIAITFDDGLASLATAARLLGRYGYQATAFLVTGRMGGDSGWPGQPAGIRRRKLLAWSELAALARDGIRFGAHTVSHCRLDHCESSALDHELREAREAIEERCGSVCRLLAYPYGSAPARVRRAAAGFYEAAFTTELRSAAPGVDPFAIPRIDAYYLRTRRDLDRLIGGRWDAALTPCRWLRGLRDSCRAWAPCPVDRQGRLLSRVHGMEA